METTFSHRELIRLSDAVLAVSGERDLAGVLRILVDQARTLIDCQYAALGVPDDSGRRLRTFVTSGMTEGTCIGSPPTGLGILGVVLHEGKTLRLQHLMSDPRAVGFPEGHPPMRSFLGVPVRHGDDVIGDLYLTEKNGAAEFSDEDQSMAELLARHAAIAIHNAGLLERLRESEARFRVLVNQAPIVVFALDAEDRISFVSERIEELTGREPGIFAGLPLRDLVLPQDRSIVDLHLASIRSDASPRQLTVAVRDIGDAVHYVEIVLAPAAGDDTVYGVAQDVTERRRLTRQVAERSTQLRSTLDEQERLREFVALVIQAQEDERRRIAGDLHDTTVQTLTAIGRRLASLASGAPSRERAEELDELSSAALEEANEVRRLSRNLRPSVLDHLGLDAALGQLMRELEESGFAVRFSIEGDTATLDDSQRTTIFRVAQEAITNVRRHSNASEVQARLHVGAELVLLEIVDNGRGFRIPRGDPGEVAHSGKLGLPGMRERASILGGSLTITSQPGEGTAVAVRLPVGR